MTVSRNGVVPLILAGGRGTRIAHLFPDLPKPAIPVCGKPFLAWILNQLSKAGFSKVVVSGGYLFDVLKEKVTPHIPTGMSVVWIQEKRPLGTGGGVIHAAKESGLHPAFWLVMNGDSYLQGNWLRMTGSTENERAYLWACRASDTGRYGRLDVNQGSLQSFREKQGGGSGLINAGIYLIPSFWLNAPLMIPPRSIERDLIPEWLTAGKKMTVFETEASFLDIGTPETLGQADAFFSSPEVFS